MRGRVRKSQLREENIMIGTQRGLEQIGRVKIEIKLRLEKLARLEHGPECVSIVARQCRVRTWAAPSAPTPTSNGQHGSKRSYRLTKAARENLHDGARVVIPPFV